MWVRTEQCHRVTFGGNDKHVKGEISVEKQGAHVHRGFLARSWLGRISQESVCVCVCVCVCVGFNPPQRVVALSPAPLSLPMLALPTIGGALNGLMQ